MDIVKNLNSVIDYIDDHITDRIDLDELSKIALCSSYHLSRIFPFLIGISLSEYIRRRKLTMAALELSQTDISVLDVSIKYGYDSPTAFTQAFKNIHSIVPSAAKEKGVALKLYPKICFQLSLKGDIAMNYRIEKREAFYLTGIRTPIQKIDEHEDFGRISELWYSLSEQDAAALLVYSNGLFPGLIGASANNQDAAFDYYIGVSSERDEHFRGENSVAVPALEWAVFSVDGALPDAMIDVWKRIFTQWFPNSGYECANAPCLEIYSEGDLNASDYHSELWIPIVRTAK